MPRNKRWTKEEDLVVLSKVKQYPYRLKKAFEEASAELNGRTPGSCCYRWYTHISKDTDKTNTCFVVISKNKCGRNRKNCTKEIPKHSKGSIWAKLLKYFFK
jgi:hypothetical protein